MTRFERELSGALGAFWKNSAEKELAGIKADLENGKITIDEKERPLTPAEEEQGASIADLMKRLSLLK